MTVDVLAEQPYLFLGSRLKRLAERMQGDAGQMFAARGYAFQSGHMGLLAVLDRDGVVSVGDAVAALGISQPAVTRSLAGLVGMGLVNSETDPSDRRARSVSLTDAGRSLVTDLKAGAWPALETAVVDMLGAGGEAFVAEISRIERELRRASFHERALHRGLRIVDYQDALAPLFHDINAEWIEAMFRMEDGDRAVLRNPRETIIDKGGAILFVEAPGEGIIGTGALKPDGGGAFELTKMGVLERVRGLKAGEFLLRALIDRARQMGVETLYLLTNSACAAAIHLYEKHGFRHDAGIMADHGARYQRCDVAMRYVG